MHDQYCLERELFIGQKVMVKNLRLQGQAWVPGVVAEELGPLTYLIQVEGGMFWRRHVDLLQEMGILSESPEMSSQGDASPLVLPENTNSCLESEQSMENHREEDPKVTPHSSDLLSEPRSFSKPSDTSQNEAKANERDITVHKDGPIEAPRKQYTC